MADIVLMCC